MKTLIAVLLSTLKLIQKSERSTENGITFPDAVKNPSAFPVTIGTTVLLTSSITLIFFEPVQFMGHCSSSSYVNTISTLNQQLTNLQQTHIRCSLPCEGWTVKVRDCASALHSFNKFTYQTDEKTKHLLQLKSWVISGNPGRWMEFRRLWWTVIVFKCSHLVHLFDFYCLLVRNLLFFFEKLLFLFTLMTLSEK